jgi:hypothetical protein
MYLEDQVYNPATFFVIMLKNNFDQEEYSSGVTYNYNIK